MAAGHRAFETVLGDDALKVEVGGPGLAANIRRCCSLRAYASTTACIFADWDRLAGIGWYSPASLGGEVSIGQVGSNFTVTSSDPSLTDQSSLSWQINGPTAINYTLTNNSIARRQLIESFIAGVLAALSAALAVEAAKNAIGKVAEPEADTLRIKPSARADRLTSDYANKHPVITAALIMAMFLAGWRRPR